MGYHLTRQTTGGQRQTGAGWRGLTFDRRKTVALGKGCSQLKAGQKGSPGSHCPTAFGGGNSALPGWEGDGIMEWVWLCGSVCAHVGPAGRCMYTLQGVSGWMCMAVFPFNTQRESWKNLIQ